MALPFQRGDFSQEYACVLIEFVYKAASARCNWARFPFPGMQRIFAIRIFVPGMGDLLLNLVHVGRIDRQNFSQILVQDGAARERNLEASPIPFCGTSPYTM